MIKRAGSVIILILMIMNGLLIFLPSTAQASSSLPDPWSIRFFQEEEEQVADVRGGEHSTVSFPGVIETSFATGSGVEACEIILFGRNDLNWPITIDPQTPKMGSMNSTYFVVKVVVPPETSNYITNTITMYGYMIIRPTNLTYTFQPIYGMVRVAQYYHIVFECDKAFNSITAGEKTSYDLEIWNYGNGRDTATLVIENFEDLTPEDIELRLDTYTVEIDEKSKTIDSIKVSTSRFTEPGVYEIKIAFQQESCYISELDPGIILYLNVESYFLRGYFCFVFPALIIGLIVLTYFVKRTCKRPAVYIIRRRSKKNTADKASASP